MSEHLGLAVAQLQGAQDIHHNEQLLKISSEASQVNRDLAKINETLKALHQKLQDDQEGPYDLSPAQEALEYLTGLYNKMKEDDHDAKFSQSDLPEDFLDLTKADVETFIRNIESLRSFKQNQLPDLMTQLRTVSELAIAIIEVIRRMADTHSRANEHIQRNMANRS